MVNKDHNHNVLGSIAGPLFLATLIHLQAHDDAVNYSGLLCNPQGPSTQYLRTLIPKAIKGRVFGTRVLKRWVLGPSALCSASTLADYGLPPQRWS